MNKYLGSTTVCQLVALFPASVSTEQLANHEEAGCFQAEPWILFRLSERNAGYVESVAGTQTQIQLKPTYWEKLFIKSGQDCCFLCTGRTVLHSCHCSKSDRPCHCFMCCTLLVLIWSAQCAASWFAPFGIHEVMGIFYFGCEITLDVASCGDVAVQQLLHDSVPQHRWSCEASNVPQ